MDKTTRKSLLYRGGFANTEYCLNHAEGCAHGCRYPCYAYLMKKSRGKVKDYQDWCRPKLVENALELLDVELFKLRGKITRVYMCFATDLFMEGYPKIGELSLTIIDRLNAAGIPVTTLTKGVYPRELADRNKGAGKDNYFGVTAVSLNTDYKNKYEPGAADVKKRLESLKYLKEKGFRTWASLEPYPPPSFVRQNIKEVLDAVAFVEQVAVGKVAYNRNIYEDNKDVKGFYKEVYSSIWDFCKKKNINYFVPVKKEKKPETGVQLELKLV